MDGRLVLNVRRVKHVRDHVQSETMSNTSDQLALIDVIQEFVIFLVGKLRQSESNRTPHLIKIRHILQLLSNSHDTRQDNGPFP